MLDGLFQDLRFGLRLLRRSPGFTVVAALTLALGIGATTAAFSVVNAVIMRPLRFPQPARLMGIFSTSQRAKDPFGSAQGVFFDWRERTTNFEIFAGVRQTSKIWTGAGDPRPANIGAASSDFFRLIGVTPLLGRTFSKQEDQAGQGAVALLDAGFWRREFGADPNVLGRKIILDDTAYDVIGVLPAGIHFGYFSAAEVWIPLAANPNFRTGGDVIAVGRLRDGVTRAAAQAEMESVMRQIGREHIEDSKTGVLVRPLQDWVVGDVRRTFLLLLGAVAFVLLISCANIANLLLARSASRRREMAIRASLGAGRFRLVRQTLVESILLAAIGGAIGIGLAFAAVRAAPSIRAFYIPRLEEIAIDGTVLAMAVCMSLASGILFGLAPALQIEHRGWGVALHAAAGPASGRIRGQRIRNALVVTQLALALVLLSGAGLMTNSLIRLMNIDLGFERSNLLTVSARLPFKKSAHGAEFLRQLAAELGRMPGVQEVSVADHAPLQAVLFPYRLRSANAGVDRSLDALARHVDSKYLRVTGIPLLAGRDFERGDDTRQPVPVLINKTTARILFEGENPIGKHLATNYRSRRELEVVGVVGDARQLRLTTEPGPQLYVPLVYGPASYAIARLAANAGDLRPAIRSAARSLDPEVPAPEVSTMDASFSREIAKPRFYLGLLAAFAAAGLILAAIGIFGVMSYTIAQRTHEFGVRMALGAERGDILRLVLGAGMRVTAVGTVLGLAGSIAATRLLGAMLYEVRPGDPLTLACVVALLASIALLACYTASRKATAVEPSVALKHE